MLFSRNWASTTVENSGRHAKSRQPEIRQPEIRQSEIPGSSSGKVRPFSRQPANRGAVRGFALLTCIVAVLGITAKAQTSSPLPFDVSNPKHLDWPTDEANRIYASACELVARSIRPEKPPRLAPRFLLVLGSDEDATLRNGHTVEIHLKEWDPARFAEAMVLMATREILKNEDVMSLTRDTLMAAQASVSVSELKHKK
jgi:hypothetical protein